MNLYRFLTVVVFGGLIACGDSMAPQVSGGPDFPLILQSILDVNCIRGEATNPSTQSGTLETTDCPTSGSALVGLTDNGYYEGFRVRVETSEPATLTVTSGVDTFLDLFLTDLTTDPFTGTLLAFDDDSNGGTDGMLTFTLQPDTEYWVMISGNEAVDVGSYTFTIS